MDAVAGVSTRVVELGVCDVQYLLVHHGVFGHWLVLNRNTMVSGLRLGNKKVKTECMLYVLCV